MFLPREKKHRYYVDHREGLFYIRTNKDGKNFAVVTAPESDPAPKNWKVFHPAPGRRAAARTSICSGTSRFRSRNRRRSTSCACTISRPGNGRSIAFPEPVYAASPGGHAGF